jgi:predicted TIM-barrel fold metal-dependent hydrolase
MGVESGVSGAHGPGGGLPPWPLFDVDQHYYEAEDAFTRHLDPAYRSSIRWVQLDGHKRLLVGDRLFRMVANPSFDPVAKPGALAAYYRAKNTSGADPKAMMEMEPIRPEYRERDARLAVMRRQGLDGIFLLPTLALGIEEVLHDDPPALYAAFRSFNRWLDEDWGFARDERIIAPPLVTLVDPELAEKDLQWLIDQGARAICFRPAPVVGPFGSRSPADPMYDRFWSTVEEAGLLVAYHAADSGYSGFVESWGERTSFRAYKDAPLTEIVSLHIERPIFDTLAALVAHGLFDRHPNLRVATVELGSGWVRELLRRLDVAHGKMPKAFGRDPVETFRDHVWVTPFHEERVAELVDLIGADHVLFGSDWPHPEGIGEPSSFLADVAELPEEQQRLITSENPRRLLLQEAVSAGPSKRGE